MIRTKFDMVTILGPTASGKTDVAVNLAHKVGGEIISADSRQVYRKMNLGTGKDLEVYNIQGHVVPYHLIDIADAGYQYNVFEYQCDFLNIYLDLKSRQVLPILCGGSGMYLEAVLKGYKMIQVPVNDSRRMELQSLSLKQLTDILRTYKTINNTSDIENKKRALRAIEIEEYRIAHPDEDFSFPYINSLIVGIKFDRDSRRSRISSRLKERLENGMIEEVENLIASGLKPEELTYYGLEYKYLTLYITGQLSYEEIENSLNIAIHQFAKRQMTWFRKMEREGIHIHWLDGYMPMGEKIDKIFSWLIA